MKGPGSLGKKALWGGSLVAALTLLAGCSSRRGEPVYENEEGFRFTPPPGWSERVRATSSAPTAPPRPGGLSLPPLPPLDVPTGVSQERLLARYDRPSAGRQAWLRVTAADVPMSLSLEECLAARAPGPEWRREEDVKALRIAGRPAARVAFAGSWAEQEYLSETAAVRHGEKVYFIAASFPATDATAREQVRQAVAGATWR